MAVIIVTRSLTRLSSHRHPATADINTVTAAIGNNHIMLMGGPYDDINKMLKAMLLLIYCGGVAW